MERPQRKIEIVPETSPQLTPMYTKAIALTAQHYQTMTAFVQAQMQKDVDYGVIPPNKETDSPKTWSRETVSLIQLTSELSVN